MSAAKEPKKLLSVSRAEMGKADTLRYNVNYYLLHEEYDRAVNELENYKSKEFDLPKYKEKIIPYLNHAMDLVRAIQAKKSLFDNPSLTRSKLQELQDTVRSHYDELQAMFKKMDQIRNQLQMEDVRSTVWVIQALVYSAVAIILVFLIKEMTEGLVMSFDLVWTQWTNDIVNDFFDWVDNRF